MTRLGSDADVDTAEIASTRFTAASLSRMTITFRAILLAGVEIHKFWSKNARFLHLGSKYHH
jgi:hypothetical protein